MSKPVAKIPKVKKPAPAPRGFARGADAPPSVARAVKVAAAKKSAGRPPVKAAAAKPKVRLGAVPKVTDRSYLTVGQDWSKPIPKKEWDAYQKAHAHKSSGVLSSIVAPVGLATGAAVAAADVAKHTAPGALKVAKKVAVAVPGPGPVLAAARLTKKATGGKVDLEKVAKGAIKNAPADAAELVLTTPTSVAKLGDTAIHDPKKLPGMLAAPYIEAVKHPLKAIEEHPVSTALMFAPVAKAPGLAAGKALRAAGKQTLEGAAAELPGTALKVARRRSRNAVTNARQARKDTASATPPTVTVRDVQRRVDATFGAEQRHGERIRAAIQREHAAEARALPKDQRGDFVDMKNAAARAQAKESATAAYAREFGSTAYRTPEGVIMRPKAGGGEAVLHASEADARAVADSLNKRPINLKVGKNYSGFAGRIEALSPLPKQQRPVTYSTLQVGDKHAVIPDMVKQRLNAQGGVGTNRSSGAKTLRMSRGMFTRAVLPFHPTWLTGQTIEGAVRSALTGAGPASYRLAKRQIAEMERQVPGSGKALLDRAVPGGKIGRATKDFAGERRTFAQEFPDSPIAHAVTKLGKTPGVKQVRDLNAQVVKGVFALNSRWLEGVPQKAMLGRQMARSPLLDSNRVIGVSDRALADAAKGFTETHNQAQLANELHRAYGKYGDFGSESRSKIMHWTPFIPWMINATQFVTSVLPKDHPLVASLTASASEATEDWRKAHDLSLRAPNHKPAFLMGSYPVNGKLFSLGKYTPFGIGQNASDPLGALAHQVLPQFSGAYAAIANGVDWKGKPLRGSAVERYIYGLSQLAGAMIPLESQAQAVLGADDKLGALRKQFRLLASVPDQQSQAATGVKIKPIKVKPVKIKRVKIKPIKLG